MKLIYKIKRREEKYVGRKLIMRIWRWIKGRRNMWLNNDDKVLKVLIMGLFWNFKKQQFEPRRFTSFVDFNLNN